MSIFFRKVQLGGKCLYTYTIHNYLYIPVMLAFFSLNANMMYDFSLISNGFL